jgi:DNA mismatch repair protein MutS2
VDKKTIEDLEFHRILKALSEHAHTEDVRERLLALEPFSTKQECENELGLVEEAVELVTHGISPSFSGATSISFSLDVATKGGVLSPAELVTIAKTLLVAHEARMALKEARIRAPKIAEIASSMPDLGAIAQRILDTFDENLRIRDDASPILLDLREKAISLGKRVRERVEELLKDNRFTPFLQDEYFTIREGRYVLPVKAEDKRFVSGIIHGSSRTGQTIYIEPEAIVQENNKLKEVLDAIQVEEYAILQERSNLVAKFANEALYATEAVFRLDEIFAKAKFAVRLNAKRPKIGGWAEPLSLVDARNPILTLLGHEPVPISLALREPPFALVLSGPNAGGKSVTLKTVGLSLLMLRHGLFVPCGEASVLPWFEEIFTLRGEQASIEQALSTFTGQVERVASFLSAQVAGRVLVILDEVLTGTDPRQGEALAIAVLEALVNKGFECIVATHYEGLKEFASSHPKLMNACMGFDPKTLKPTFVVEMGKAGQSNPIEIASNYLPKDVVQRAKKLLGEKENRLRELILETEKLKQDLEEERKEVRQLKEKLEEEKRRYEEELKRIRKNADLMVYEARKSVLEQMKRLEEELKVVEKELEEEKKRKVVIKKAEVAKKKEEVKKEMIKEASLVEDLPQEEIGFGEIRVGMDVFVFPLRAVGQVVECQDEKRIVVQIGALRTVVQLSQLRKPRPKDVKKQQGPKGAKPLPEKPNIEERSVIDVRGKRVDEALSEVEKALDHAFLSGTKEVFIIHGIGTSALRKAITEYLKTSEYCASFRAGEIQEGGDGVTIVTVK